MAICTVIFLSALLLRGIFAIGFLDLDRPPSGDEGAYHARAVQISTGQFLGSSDRPPLLGAIIAPFYLVTEESYIVGRLVNVVISSLGVPLIYLVVRLFFSGKAIPILASMAWAFYPPSIWYSGWLLTETLSSVLVIGSALSLCLLREHGGQKYALFTGFLLGMLAINRSIYILLPILVLGAYMLVEIVNRQRGFHFPSVARNCSLVICSFSLVLSPWVLHNFLLLHQFVPHSTQGGYVMMISNAYLQNPEIQSGKYIKDSRLIELVEAQNPRDQYHVNSIQRSIAMESITSNVNLLPQPIVNRFKNSWTSRPDPYDSKWTTNDSIMASIWIPLVCLFLVGLFLRPFRETWPLLLFIVYFSFIALPFWGTPRFRFPVDPMLMVLSAIGVGQVLMNVNVPFTKRLIS